MILEGIVTTLAPDRTVNLAPMGPVVTPTGEPLELRPYQTSDTYRNLKAHGEGVFHVTDDVLLLARAALGMLEPPPELQPADRVRGKVLVDCCRYYEFRISELDDRQPRTRIRVEVIHRGRVRDFFGLNRAKHAVVEAAILATRVGILSGDDIRAQFQQLQPLIDKTGGPAEIEAFALLAAAVGFPGDGRERT